MSSFFDVQLSITHCSHQLNLKQQHGSNNTRKGAREQQYNTMEQSKDRIHNPSLIGFIYSSIHSFNTYSFIHSPRWDGDTMATVRGQQGCDVTMEHGDDEQHSMQDNTMERSKVLHPTRVLHNPTFTAYPTISACHPQAIKSVIAYPNRLALNQQCNTTRQILNLITALGEVICQHGGVGGVGVGVEAEVQTVLDRKSCSREITDSTRITRLRLARSTSQRFATKQE